MFDWINMQLCASNYHNARLQQLQYENCNKLGIFIDPIYYKLELERMCASLVSRILLFG